MKPYHHVSDEERLYIQHGLRAGKTQKKIAEELDRSPSTISREIRRNKSGRCYLYTHHLACSIRRWRKRIQYKKLAERYTKIKGELAEQVMSLLQSYLSPEQVSGYLKRHEGLSICHETIYRFIFQNAIRKKMIKPYLRQGAKTRRKAYGSGARASRIPNRVSITERPSIVDERRRIGDWECDTIFGKDRKSALVTLVERKTLFTVMTYVQRRTSSRVCSAIIRLLEPYKGQVKTLTFDNGSEFIAHEKIAKALSANTYFAHPYCSWERGANENMNGLIRQFFPRGSYFTHVHYTEIKRALYLLNNRPRKTRGYKTPNELFNRQFIPLL